MLDFAGISKFAADTLTQNFLPSMPHLSGSAQLAVQYSTFLNFAAHGLDSQTSQCGMAEVAMRNRHGHTSVHTSSDDHAVVVLLLQRPGQVREGLHVAATSHAGEEDGPHADAELLPAGCFSPEGGSIHQPLARGLRPELRCKALERCIL